MHGLTVIDGNDIFMSGYKANEDARVKEGPAELQDQVQCRVEESIESRVERAEERVNRAEQKGLRSGEGRGVERAE